MQNAVESTANIRYICVCGSDIQNNPRSIDKHKETMKHKNYISNTTKPVVDKKEKRKEYDERYETKKAICNLEFDLYRIQNINNAINHLTSRSIAEYRFALPGMIKDIGKYIDKINMLILNKDQLDRVSNIKINIKRVESMLLDLDAAGEQVFKIIKGRPHIVTNGGRNVTPLHTQEENEAEIDEIIEEMEQRKPSPIEKVEEGSRLFKLMLLSNVKMDQWVMDIVHHIFKAWPKYAPMSNLIEHHKLGGNVKQFMTMFKRVFEREIDDPETYNAIKDYVPSEFLVDREDPVYHSLLKWIDDGYITESVLHSYLEYYEEQNPVLNVIKMEEAIATWPKWIIEIIGLVKPKMDVYDQIRFLELVEDMEKTKPDGFRRINTGFLLVNLRPGNHYKSMREAFTHKMIKKEIDSSIIEYMINKKD